MSEVFVSIKSKTLESIKEKINYNFPLVDIVNQALTLFKWAVNGKVENRQILSGTKLGGDLYIISMESLDNVIVKETK